MTSPEIIDLYSDEEGESIDVEDVKPFIMSLVQRETSCPIVASGTLIIQPKLEDHGGCWPFQEKITSCFTNDASIVSCRVDEGNMLADMSCDMPASPGLHTPLPKQFWKSGDYETRQAPGSSFQNGGNRLRIHPKFLHSNATSHKWAFGAIAELLDNAVDEVQNGATFVILDKFNYANFRSPALVIQDDGRGMCPEMLRRCMSFGFSDKNSALSIGQYGNGFKTSTMRLGADVIVFSRCMNKGVLTQSVGLLSYTFLRKTNSDDIVVPVVDYKFDSSTSSFKWLLLKGEKQFSSNLSTLLKWSPFSGEEELLSQFNDVGHHGTKIIVYNLWLNDDGNLELDFESDGEDILINGSLKKAETNNATKLLNQNHIANRLHYSLRAYLSILYLHIPGNFKINLRGKVVEPHNIVSDLNYLECVKYKPQVGRSAEVEVVTFLGFLHGAPNVNVHGFNVYHKNRLILPFWKVANNSYGKGRGVVGVLEANFIKPTHDKQDFEKSSLYQKLESRLKDMTYEYWDYHCHLVGYTHSKVGPPVTRLKQHYHRTRDGVKEFKAKWGPSAIPSKSFGICTNVELVKADPDMVTIGNSTISSARASQDLGVSSSFGSKQADNVLCATTTNSAEMPLTSVDTSPRGLSERRRLVNNVDEISLEKQVVGGHYNGQVDPVDVSEKRRHVNNVDEMSLKKQVVRGHYNGQDCIEIEHEQRQKILTMTRENKKLRSECLEYEEREKDLLLKEKARRSELESIEWIIKSLLCELGAVDRVKTEKR